VWSAAVRATSASAFDAHRRRCGVGRERQGGRSRTMRSAVRSLFALLEQVEH
jgi:hypothetical protein